MSESADDADSVEEECQFIGGPYDGRSFSVPREHDEYALPVEAAALFEELEDMASELTKLAATLDAFGTAEEIAGELDDDSDAEEEAYAEPAPGGVLYRRGKDGRSFHYVGHISVEELERRSGR